ncbi:MAG: hypothetical protein AB7U20_05670 [Planctomycetaceae bacterium]
MNQITIAQPDVCDQLAEVAGDVELVAADGRRLGTFRPTASATNMPPLSLEELRRRTAQPGGKTTAEVLEQLGRL